MTVKAIPIHDRERQGTPSMNGIMTTAPSRLRQHAAKALDIAIGPLSLCYLASAQAILIPRAMSPKVSLALWPVPSALWFAIAFLLAWAGQTPGQAILRVKWVDLSGACARWRPLGDTGFWACNAYMLVLDIAFCGGVIVIKPLGWSPPLAAWSLPIGAVAVVAAVMARHARHSTARLTRVSR